MDFERREIHFSGRVQGVGFRYTTYRLAQSCDVSGFVENLADGRVFLQVEGAVAELDRFFASIQDVMGHHIDDVQTHETDYTGEFTAFEIRH